MLDRELSGLQVDLRRRAHVEPIRRWVRDAGLADRLGTHSAGLEAVDVAQAGVPVTEALTKEGEQEVVPLCRAGVERTEVRSWRDLVHARDPDVNDTHVGPLVTASVRALLGNSTASQDGVS